MLVEAIRTNPLMKITGDNLDMYIRTNHQRTDNSNQDIHWFASNAFFTRLNNQNLLENTPEVSPVYVANFVRLTDIDAEMFVLTKSETMKLNNVQKVLICRLLCNRGDFQWLKNKQPQHVPHRKRYVDQERLQNAKNITYLAPTPRGRFEHLAPVTCELWHVKQDLLSKAYKALFKSDSLGECGTLFHMKTALRRNDVNGNVKSNYKAHEELFLLIVKALIHVASDEINKLIRDCSEQNRDIVLRANKTENGSRRASSSADIIHRIGDNVDHLLSIPKFTSSHAKKTSSKDLEIAINILSKVQPFKYVKGRKFESFKTIPKIQKNTLFTECQ
ncbi:unnamed protein product [Mytilus edulis]|uniref:Uncharacterized protein n=1 Tax=Mytilus edulis TaxID=6550 RepID=A0A8S3RB01_MYTED|nr:unnamed protein product [Mytilus edulis]